MNILRRPKHKWDKNIKMDLKKQEGMVWTLGWGLRQTV